MSLGMRASSQPRKKKTSLIKENLTVEYLEIDENNIPSLRQLRKWKVRTNSTYNVYIQVHHRSIRQETLGICDLH